MENATDALIMAGSVLLLIIALTVSISSFSSLRIQVDEIMTSRDKTQMAQSSSGDYLNYLKSNTNDVREVGIETVISSIRRIRKEDYEIYIVLNSTSMPDIDKSLKTTTQKQQLYYQDKNGKAVPIVTTGKEIIKLSLVGVRNKYIEDNEQLKKIYNTLKDSKFKEYIGIYQNKTEKGVSEANKQTYKTVTFVEE